jgi:hypothetical protein
MRWLKKTEKVFFYKCVFELNFATIKEQQFNSMYSIDLPMRGPVHRDGTG